MKTPQQIKDSCNLCFASYVGILILVFALLCSGCYVTSHYSDPIYDDHTTEVYYYNDLVYFGYYSGYYYYYGVPHFHPWWYYYMYMPSTHYHVHSHIHIHCGDNLFVYMHRGNKFNNKKQKEYKNFDTKHTMMRDVMVDNKLSNKDYYRKLNNEVKNRNNYHKNDKVKYNINKINYDRTFNFNNKVNNKVNKPNNIKINNNKINNRPNRSNKTNRSKPR